MPSITAGREMFSDEQEHTREHREDVDVQEDLFQGDGAVPAEEDAAVAPEGELLHQLVHTGEDHPLGPQDGGHQGDDQVAAVGVDDGGLLHRRQVQGAAQQGGEDEKQHVDADGGPQGEGQPLEQLRSAVDLEGGDDDAGDDEIQAHHGHHPAVRGLQQPQPDQQPAQDEAQKELYDLFKQQ